MPKVIKLNKESVVQATKPILKTLQELTEVNNQIITDTEVSIDSGLHELLDEGKIDQKEYDEQLKQNHAELSFRHNAERDLQAQHQRFTRLQRDAAHGDTPVLFIEGSTSRSDFKKLIAVTQAQLEVADSKKEKLFLTTVLQTVESCKTNLDAGSKLDNKTLPLLQSEMRYCSKLMKEFNIKIAMDDSETPNRRVNACLELTHYYLDKSSYKQAEKMLEKALDISKTGKLDSQTSEKLNKDIKDFQFSKGDWTPHSLLDKTKAIFQDFKHKFTALKSNKDKDLQQENDQKSDYSGPRS